MTVAIGGEQLVVKRYLGKGHRSMGWGWGDTKARDTDHSLKSIPFLTGVG